MTERALQLRVASVRARLSWPWCMARVLMLGLSLALAACGGGGGGDSSAQPPGQVDTATVSGLVVSSATGQPLQGVAVSAGSRITSTAADGRYTLTEVPKTEPSVVSFQLAGHAKGVSSLSFSSDATANADARLVPVGATQNFDAASAATLAIGGTPAQVSLPAAGLVTASGAAASGTVQAELTAIDPATDPASMPGNYTATLASGATGTIESFGALHVSLRDGAGNALNLASGKTATIRIPVATRSADVPATLPLYYLDERTGRWVQEGTATLAGTAPDRYFEGTVSHFSYWNADRPAETIAVKGCVQDAGGARVPNVMLHSQGVDYSGQAQSFADSQGNFSLSMRKGSVASVYGQFGERSTNVLRAGPSDADITLAACLVLGAGGQAPQIVQAPQAMSTQAGSYAWFGVQAVGTAPLRYQWLRNGVAISGAVSASYFINPVSESDNGAQFSVQVSNAIGSVSSDAVALTVSAAQPPVIDTAPVATTVALGDTARFSVVAYSQGGALSFQWLRDGTAIAGATATSYTSAATTAADDGAVYSVRVSSSNGTSTTSAAVRLSVVPPVVPTITQQPQSLSVNVGLTASFNVTASGPTPSFQWRRNGTPISGATSASYTTPTLTLADSGAVYSVLVSNSAGSVASSDATLTVTQVLSSSGYHLVAGAGAFASGTVVWAEGSTNISSQALIAVNASDPANPGAAIVVEPAGLTTGQLHLVMEGSVAAGQISNLRPRYRVYAKGNRFYKLDLLATGTAGPQPVLLSSLTTQEVCGRDGLALLGGEVDGNDVADPSRSWLFFTGPGADGQCGTADDVQRAVRMNMSGTTAALTLAAVPMVEIRSASGAITGFVVRVGSQVQRVDADLANAGDLFTLSGTPTNLGLSFGSSAPGIWVFADGSTLYGVNLATPATRVNLATLASGEQINSLSASGGSELFVGIDSATATRVLRITEALVATELARFGTRINELQVTDSHLIAASLSDAGSIYSVPRSGGGAQTLLTPASGEVISYVVTGGNTVLAQLVQTSVNGGVRVVLVNGDGSNLQSLAGTATVGMSQPASLSISSGLAQLYSVVLASNVQSYANSAGAALRAVNLATRATLVSYGNWPTAPNGVGYQTEAGAYQYGQPGLLSYVDVSAGQLGSDLFYFDSDAAGLRRITTTLSAQSLPPGSVTVQAVGVRSGTLPAARRVLGVRTGVARLALPLNPASAASRPSSDARR